MSFGQLQATHDGMMSNLFLTFSSDDEKFGLSIHEVREIISFQKITKVPEQPDYIRGIINLRGNVIPTVDVRKRFGQPTGQYTDHTCIIIVDMAGMSAGLIVDEVLEVMTLGMDEISELPDIHEQQEGKFISGIGKRNKTMYMLLECDRLFSDKQLNQFKNIIENASSEQAS